RRCESVETRQGRKSGGCQLQANEPHGCPRFFRTKHTHEASFDQRTTTPAGGRCCPTERDCHAADRKKRVATYEFQQLALGRSQLRDEGGATTWSPNSRPNQRPGVMA